MTVIRKFLETLDNISLDDLDVPLVILITVTILIIVFKKKEYGKTIFDGSNRSMETFDKKDDNEGYI